MTNLVADLADTFKSFGVGRAYGDPVQLGGEEIIPVAFVQFGFGGGGTDGAANGTDGTAGTGTAGTSAAGMDTARSAAASGRGRRQAKANPAGGGAGGGGLVIPIGVYRANAGGKPVFRPNTLAVLLCLLPVVWATGRAVAGVVRAARG